MHNIQITPTTSVGRPGFYVSGGIQGTGVFIQSALIARTVAQVLRDEARGELTATERWTIIEALVRDDELGYQPVPFCADCAPHVNQESK